MTWLGRRRIRQYLKSSFWVMPVAAAGAGVLLHRLVWVFDLWTRWRWLDFTPEGASALVTAFVSSGLTFIVFLLSMLFIAVQLAASQMTPLLTSRLIEGSANKLSLAFFVFAYVFSTAVGGRLAEPIPQLAILVAVVLSLAGIGLFLFLVGHTARAVRPVTVFGSVADETTRVIDAMYPVLLAEPKRGAEIAPAFAGTTAPKASIFRRGKPGIFNAFDACGLAEIARKNDLVIEIVPQVGDLVAEGDALFHVYPRSTALLEEELQRRVAFGSAHTMEQHPSFGLRIIVDIAIRALSPAINDPTTAVQALDRIQILLQRIGERDLGDGWISDREGRPRLIVPAPGWEDFLWLGISEIRSYGASSLPVMRRLRGMLENLIEELPPHRIPALLKHLEQLNRVARRNFTDSEDLLQAGIGDYQGLGGARLRHSQGAYGTGGRDACGPSAGETPALPGGTA